MLIREWLEFLYNYENMSIDKYKLVIYTSVINISLLQTAKILLNGGLKWI